METRMDTYMSENGHAFPSDKLLMWLSCSSLQLSRVWVCCCYGYLERNSDLRSLLEYAVILVERSSVAKRFTKSVLSLALNLPYHLCLRLPLFSTFISLCYSSSWNMLSLLLFITVLVFLVMWMGISTGCRMKFSSLRSSVTLCLLNEILPCCFFFAAFSQPQAESTETMSKYKLSSFKLQLSKILSSYRSDYSRSRLFLICIFVPWPYRGRIFFLINFYST